ncbi:DNA cytosine methyltransferase [Flavobacteriaceae bacterium]|nr:DNA cytosine methyltransferase [Flavobacteriaceae bacterium]
MNLNYIDLFSGAGGMSLGIKSAGGNLIFSNEIDKDAVKTQKINLQKLADNPEKVIQCSIEELHKEVVGKEIEFEYQSEKVHYHKSYKKLYKNESNLNDGIIDQLRCINDVDLIVGGPPCQGFSNAGRGGKSSSQQLFQTYIDDPRNQLFKYFLDFVEYYSPKAVIIENVKGLATSKNYRQLIQASLENTGKGYHVISTILNAENYGIPQSRERIFFIGIRKDLKDSELFSFYLPTLLIKSHERKKLTLKEGIYDLPNILSNPKPSNLKPENEIPIGDKGSFGENVSKLPYEKLVTKKNEYVDRINSFRGQIIQPKKLYNHKARYNNDLDLKIYSLLEPGVSLSDIRNQEASELNKYSTKSFGDKYYKLNPDKPSRTIVAHLQMDNNGYVHYGEIPRGITPREAARIQSFPDWYEFKGPFTKQFKQIGNAVPPLLAKELYLVIKEYLVNGIEV